MRKTEYVVQWNFSDRMDASEQWLDYAGKPCELEKSAFALEKIAKRKGFVTRVVLRTTTTTEQVVRPRKKGKK